MGASFAIATGGVLTLFIAASPNAGSVWVRVVDEVSGAVFEQEVTADLPAANQFLAPRLFMNNGATAAAVAFDCSGVYLETNSDHTRGGCRRGGASAAFQSRQGGCAHDPAASRCCGVVRLSDADLEAMLARAAEEGARRALSDVGLGGKDAVLTIHDMRFRPPCT